MSGGAAAFWGGNPPTQSRSDGPTALDHSIQQSFDGFYTSPTPPRRSVSSIAEPPSQGVVVIFGLLKLRGMSLHFHMATRLRTVPGGPLERTFATYARECMRGRDSGRRPAKAPNLSRMSMRRVCAEVCAGGTDSLAENPETLSSWYARGYAQCI